MTDFVYEQTTDERWLEFRIRQAALSAVIAQQRVQGTRFGPNLFQTTLEHFETYLRGD